MKKISKKGKAIYALNAERNFYAISLIAVKKQFKIYPPIKRDAFFGYRLNLTLNGKRFKKQDLKFLTKRC